MKSYVFTADHSGLPLATHLQDGGENVTLVLIHPTRKNGKIETPKTPEETKQVQDKVQYLNKNGNGLVKKMWATDAMGRIKKGDYVIFDQIYGWQYGDALYKRGVKVLGGSKTGFTLETERRKTLDMLKSMGYDMPFTKYLGPGSSKAAIDFLKNAKDGMLFCFKSDAPGVVTQVAHDSNEELIKKITAEAKAIDADGCMFQEKIGGLEFNVETWYSNGKPVLANVDIEIKKKYNEMSEVQTGCVADLVWVIPVDHPLRKRVNGPCDAFAKKYISSGRLDLSVIYDPHAEKMYPLEVCGDRPGYNQVFTLMEQLNMPIGEFHRDFLDGKYTGDIGAKCFKPGYGVSLRVFNDCSSKDQRIDFPPELREHYWLWDNYLKGKNLMTTGGEHGESVGVITASGENPESAFAQLRKYYFKLNLTTKWCRDRFDEDDDKNLPLARFHEMERLSLI